VAIAAAWQMQQGLQGPSGHDVAQRQASAWSEHPGAFPKASLPAGEMDDALHRQHHSEGPIRQGHGAGVAGLTADPVLCPWNHPA